MKDPFIRPDTYPPPIIPHLARGQEESRSIRAASMKKPPLRVPKRGPG